MQNYRLCSEDYEEVKGRLSMRQVAEHYGCRVNQKGQCLCPFHDDKHPSVKIYEKSFYCFSCGIGGDLITFVARMQGGSNEEACKTLIQDFSLPIGHELTYREKRERDKRLRERKKLSLFVRRYLPFLIYYRCYLCEAAQDPQHPGFTEAMQELTITEYRIKSLEESPGEVYKDRRVVKKIGDIERRIIGGAINLSKGSADSG